MNTHSNIAAKLKDPEYRKAYVSSQISVGLPFQIRALMKARGWKQEQLAERAHMLQPRISGMMKPGKSRPNIETLRRLAEAFDCGLIVRFAPFSELVQWSENFDPEDFDVPSFNNDRALESEACSESVESALLAYQTEPSVDRIRSIEPLFVGGVRSAETAQTGIERATSVNQNRMPYHLVPMQRSQVPRQAIAPPAPKLPVSLPQLKDTMLMVPNYL